MKKNYLNKYNENNFLEILTYLYEIPFHISHQRNIKIEYPINFKGQYYNSIFESQNNKHTFRHQDMMGGSLVYDFMNLQETKIKKIKKLHSLFDLIDGQLSKDNEKPKIEIYLYKKVPLEKFKNTDFNDSIVLNDMELDEFQNLPITITDTKKLPDEETHTKFLEKNFEKENPYRKKKSIFTGFTKSYHKATYEFCGAIWNKKEINNYHASVKENNNLYKKYKTTYDNIKKSFHESQKKERLIISQIISEYELGTKKGILNYLQFIINLAFLDKKKAKPKNLKIEYDQNEKILIVNLKLPDFNRVSLWEYILKQDRIIQFDEMDKAKIKRISKTKHKEIAENSLYIIPIRTIFEFFRFDTKKFFKHIALNGIVESYNNATGNLEKNNVLSLFVDREKVLKLNLAKVNPKECFKLLKGVSASKIHENIAVNPILTFKKDKRMIKSKAILDNLKEQNLAVMPWDEFEHLIRELFAKRFSKDGEEVKITQSSRDRGVDAIAYDPDPIRGGKYIIQAKRYTATVDVSAVRDLYGAIHNEGANRGILVTTSSYGADSYNFAKDKNISLINGSELLGLLKRYGYSFKIDIAEARKILNLTPKKSY